MEQDAPDDQWLFVKDLELFLGIALYRDVAASQDDLVEAESLLQHVIDTLPDSLKREGEYLHERYLIEAAWSRECGGFRKYLRRPHMELWRLRSLITRGRAEPRP